MYAIETRDHTSQYGPNWIRRVTSRSLKMILDQAAYIRRSDYPNLDVRVVAI